MDMEKEILSRIEMVSVDLLQQINALTDAEFNQSPFPGSWTAGQLAEHVYLSVAKADRLLTGESEMTTRNPEEKIETLAAIFLNFEKKLTPPDHIIPQNPPHDKVLLYNQLKDAFGKIVQAGRGLDLTRICTRFELPVFGKLTRLEYLHFILFHTQRHHHQLKNIVHALHTQAWAGSTE